MRKQTPASALFDPKIVWPAIGSAFVKLDPRTLMKNPVMFVLEIVTALTTIILIRDLVTGGANIGFEFQIVLWLWFTVLFANFAEAVAEGRGKAQADALRRNVPIRRRSSHRARREGPQIDPQHQPEGGRGVTRLLGHPMGLWFWFRVGEIHLRGPDGAANGAIADRLTT